MIFAALNVNAVKHWHISSLQAKKCLLQNVIFLIFLHSYLSIYSSPFQFAPSLPPLSLSLSLSLYLHFSIFLAFFSIVFSFGFLTFSFLSLSFSLLIISHSTLYSFSSSLFFFIPFFLFFLPHINPLSSCPSYHLLPFLTFCLSFHLFHNFSYFIFSSLLLSILLFICDFFFYILLSSFSLSLPPSLSLSHTHTHTHICTNTLFLSLSLHDSFFSSKFPIFFLYTFPYFFFLFFGNHLICSSLDYHIFYFFSFFYFIFINILLFPSHYQSLPFLLLLFILLLFSFFSFSILLGVFCSFWFCHSFLSPSFSLFILYIYSIISLIVLHFYFPFFFPFFLF
ncbi:unnamed protein product [Acanthosepion pharaonis]|uniref:Uncharacterized protein n=1 Tax=Acanthosepion pharaonis TaxID=158019 RepID=A0A812E5T0_ACAPH|nr:unnamed protein product [Sepia pharaonis]